MKSTITVPIIALLFFCSGCSRNNPEASIPTATVSATATPVAREPQVGDEVVVTYGDAFYQLQTVTKLNGDTATVENHKKKSKEVQLSEIKQLKPQDWEVGDEVLALFYAGDFKSGKITAKKDEDTYSVRWSGSESTADVLKKYILAFSLLSEPEVPGEVNGKVETGSIVAAPFGKGYFLATVDSVEGEKATVLHFRGNKTEAKVAEIRPIIVQKWNEGDKVFALWSPGGLINAGVIEEVIGDDTYMVSYAAGGQPKRVSARRIVAAD